MRILILTTNSGGPHLWAKSFKDYCAIHHKELDITIRWGLRDIIKSHFSFNKYDIIHSTVPVLWNFSKTPLVLNFRGNFKKELSLRYPFNILYSWSKLLTKHYLSPSVFLNKKLGILASIMPNAIDIDSYTKKNSYELSQPIRLVVVTRFDIYEKARGVIDLSRILQTSSQKYICDVYGEGRYLNQIKKKSPNVNFKGKSNDLKSLLSTYDVFLYYSYLDNFPNAILDAMATKLPIITNDVGAIKEMLDSSQGKIVKTPKEFAAVFEKVLQSIKLRQSLATNAHKKITENYSWSVVAKKLIKYYKEVLNEN